MRALVGFLLVVTLSVPLSGQTSRPPAAGRSSTRAQSAEMAVTQAIEQLGRDKKTFDRDLAVLKHLRAADEALIDPMQPSVAVQKAFDHVDAALQLEPEFRVKQGVIQARSELEGARRSPASADFGRLRAILSREATVPAVKLVIRNAVKLQEETVQWIKVQELISQHLRVLSEITGESLRSSQ